MPFPTDHVFLRLCIALYLWAIFSSAYPTWLPASQDPPSNEVLLQVIVVPSSEQAKQVLERLNQGEEFAKIAREVSTDPTASEGGFMGKVDPASLRAELRDVLQGVRPGQISSIAHIPSGYIILKVLSDAPDAPASPRYMGAAAPNLGVAAAGSIRYVLDVGGILEAESILAEYPKPPGWDQDLQTICAMRRSKNRAEFRRTSWSCMLSGLRESGAQPGMAAPLSFACAKEVLDCP